MTSLLVPLLALAAAAPAAATPAPATAPAPPRFDGWYLGLGGFAAVGFPRVQVVDTPQPFVGPGASLRIGQVVLPWMSIGLEFLGQLSWANPGARQRLGVAGLMMDLGFFPIRHRGLVLRGSFGFGGGGVREEGRSGRKGFGGPLFGVGAGWTFFPSAARKRPTRGGGLGLGPEVSYLVATPAASGRPMAHALWVGLVVTMYFGE